jgi:prophage regulatory protein
MESTMHTTSQQSVAPLPTEFIRLNPLKERLGVSGSSIWAWTKAGKFPKPIKLSENCTAWNVADVEAWAQSRISASQR